MVIYDYNCRKILTMKNWDKSLFEEKNLFGVLLCEIKFYKGVWYF